MQIALKLSVFLIVSVFLVSCKPQQGQTENVERYFNGKYIVGLETDPITRYEDVKLDYSLNRTTGEEIFFKNCIQVESTQETLIRESQFTLFRLLALNCAALRLYTESQSAKRSFMPSQFDEDLLLQLPATAVPRYNNEDLLRRSGYNLAKFDKNITIQKLEDKVLKLTSNDGIINYNLLAASDFNADGIQDYLIRVDWYGTQEFGKGSDLFIISKSANQSPIKVIWRHQ